MLVLPGALVWAEQRGRCACRARARRRRRSPCAGRAAGRGARGAPCGPRAVGGAASRPQVAGCTLAQVNDEPRSALRRLTTARAGGRGGAQRRAPLLDRGRRAVPGIHRVRRHQRADERQRRARRASQAGKRLPPFAAPVRDRHRSTATRTSTRRRPAGSRCATRSGSATTSTGRSCWSPGSASAAGTASRCSTPSSGSAGGSRTCFVGLDIARLARTRRARPCAKNGWGFPMAVDRDGAVGPLYSRRRRPHHLLRLSWRRAGRARRSAS